MLGAPIPGEDRVASTLPLALAQDGPHPLRVAAQAAWENRDRLAYAGALLRHGVCDGCALGPRGLRDDAGPGLHLCSLRLQRLRLETVGGLAPADLVDVERLRRMTAAQLRALGRLSQPFLLKAGGRGFDRCTWDEATALLTAALRGAAPERLGLLASPGAGSNEALFALVRAFQELGTGPIALCDPHGQAATESGLRATLGVPAATCGFSDLIGTDLVLVFEADLEQDQPQALRYLAEAKALGTRVVVIDADPSRGGMVGYSGRSARSALFGTRLVDDLVPIAPGGAQAFLVGLIQALLARSTYDADFVERRCTGLAELRSSVEAWSLEDIEARSGSSLDRIAWVAELLARARGAVSIFGRGFSQQPQATGAVAALAGLHLLMGFVGRPGCGILPLHGGAGDQGAADIFGGLGLGAPGARPLLAAAAAGDLDLLWTLGEDLLASLPDPGEASALGRPPLRVHQATFLDPAFLVEPGQRCLLLPVLNRHEQPGGGTLTSAERRIRFSPQLTDQVPGDARPAWELPAALVERLRPGRSLGSLDAAALRTRMEVELPRYTGISAMASPGDWVQWGGDRLCVDGFPAMPGGRARLLAVDPPATTR